MPADVIEFPGIEIDITAEVHANPIVDLLEDWLDRAKRGEVAALAICAVSPTHLTTHTWVENDGMDLYANDLAISVQNLQFTLTQLRLDDGDIRDIGC